MTTTAPILALVGRPNVGKSTLFNRILRKKVAIIEDQEGVTRDRNYAFAKYEDQEFILVDTGGIEAKATSEVFKQMREQSIQVMQEADAILLVTDVQSGWTAGDQEIYHSILPLKKNFF